jgi:hypothetical protein
LFAPRSTRIPCMQKSSGEQPLIGRRRHCRHPGEGGSQNSDPPRRRDVQVRHLVENFFQRIKEFRRIATRYDKIKTCYVAAILPRRRIPRSQLNVPSTQSQTSKSCRADTFLRNQPGAAHTDSSCQAFGRTFRHFLNTSSASQDPPSSPSTSKRARRTTESSSSGAPCR